LYGLATWLCLSAYDQGIIYMRSALEQSLVSQLTVGLAYLIVYIFIIYTMLPLPLHWVS